MATAITAFVFEMYPENMLPFLPVENAIRGGFQVFGDLPEGDYKSLGVDAAA